MYVANKEHNTTVQ